MEKELTIKQLIKRTYLKIIWHHFNSYYCNKYSTIVNQDSKRNEHGLS